MGVKKFILKRIPFCKPKIKRKYNGTNVVTPVQNTTHVEMSADIDNASIGSGHSNLSTGALQNIREQMAVSLERMRELEEQVKAIPMLQVQVSVLKEEKRNLLRQMDELNKYRDSDDSLRRFRSQSFSEKRTCSLNSMKSNTRDIGIMCGVMTRDVGISQQQIRTRDRGMVTSTPIKRTLQKSGLQITDIIPETNGENNRINVSDCSPSRSSDSHDSWKSVSSRNEMMEDMEFRLYKYTRGEKKYCHVGTNTNGENRWNHLERGHLAIEDIRPESKKLSNRGINTLLTMTELLTKEDVSYMVDNALRNYKNSQFKETSSKSVQCSSAVVEKRDEIVQTSELFRMRTNVSVTAKPKTSEIGIEVRINPDTKSIGTGPDPMRITEPISLNSMNSRSHSFNYGDTKAKRKTTKSVGVMVEDLIKTKIRSTDTFGLAPKKREFGTSPIKKKFVDVSVGDSVKPSHIFVSCTTNYCDNCKEIIKNLAKQISTNGDNIINNQNVSPVSRIPRPSHIPLSTPPDHRKQFKRQDTYTKLPSSGVIKYDADDNKDQYGTDNRLQELESERNKDDKTIDCKEERSENEEKHELPESALFQPIQDKPRKKAEPTKEMKAAMKVLNDHLKKSLNKNISYQVKNAINIIQQEWFKISSVASANPLEVEDYLDCFEVYSSYLLEYIVNMTDSSGNTAMHYAVSHGNFDVVSILLDSKVCDIDRANMAGYTAVMLAALAEVGSSTHASVANRLFQLADVNIRAKLHGQTALMLAVSHGRKDMTQLLLDAGAAVNIQDEDGSTALMCAAEHGHTDIVRLLLSHPDCDPSIVDIDGSSALKIALEASNRDIGVLLYAHEHVNRGTSPYSSTRRSRRGSKPTTPTGPSSSAPASPAPSRRVHSSNPCVNTSKYTFK